MNLWQAIAIFGGIGSILLLQAIILLRMHRESKLSERLSMLDREFREHVGADEGKFREVQIVLADIQFTVNEIKARRWNHQP